ncbi:MAG: ABC transporter permease subunit [Treponema sp.]|jgi:putative aldouronate transport system permease protein|nr:ABC transporter permease subunit [Treponema sp.]
MRRTAVLAPSRRAFRNPLMRRLFDQRYLLLLSLPFVIWLIVFKYIPLTGWAMAFQDYKPQNGFFNQDFAGLKHFKALFAARQFYQALQNTLGMSFLGLVFGFTTSIGFAILLNELRTLHFKRFTQTISYLPHFVSWVIVANIVTNILSPSGPVNELLVKWGIVERPYNFMIQQDLFWWIVVFSDVWKETGWNAIIYLAAITGIDAAIYEAAEIDGVNRLQKIWYITLPGIKSTITILLIMSIGNIINIGFEKQMLLGNSVVSAKSLVLDKYALDYGIGLFRYSFGTAIGIFKSVVSIILLIIANTAARKVGEDRLI